MIVGSDLLRGEEPHFATEENISRDDELRVDKMGSTTTAIIQDL